MLIFGGVQQMALPVMDHEGIEVSMQLKRSDTDLPRYIEH